MISPWIARSLTISLLLASSAYAQQAESVLQETETELTTTTTATLEDQANIWGITVEDYHRFEEAMNGPRGRFSGPNITPIEVLGIEARTPPERERFAELWVSMIRADTTKVLEFTRTVNETWVRLHGDQPLIDRAYLNKRRLELGQRPLPETGHTKILADPTKVAAQDQLLLFTNTDCQACNADTLRLISQLQNSDFAGLDIYLLDVPDGDVAAIQHWAASIGIPPPLVQSGRLTLNFDGGAYQQLLDRLQFTPSTFPVVMRRQGQSYDLVSLR